MNQPDWPLVTSGLTYFVAGNRINGEWDNENPYLVRYHIHDIHNPFLLAWRGVDW